jgi:hypothetical protein
MLSTQTRAPPHNATSLLLHGKEYLYGTYAGSMIEVGGCEYLMEIAAAYPR